MKTPELEPALFRKLGAENPESWARSQVNEGINQLGRFLFLRAAWREVVAPDDAGWIESEVERAGKRPNDPGAGAGLALRRILAAGAAREDVHELVRVMQWQLLSSLCYLLDDSGELEPEVADFAWKLMQVDDNEDPVGRIDCLHESVLGMDPSGREMRPRR